MRFIGQISSAMAIVVTVMAMTATAELTVLYEEDFEGASYPAQLETDCFPVSCGGGSTGVWSGGDWTQQQDSFPLSVDTGAGPGPFLVNTTHGIDGDTAFAASGGGGTHSTVDHVAVPSPADLPGNDVYQLTYDAFVTYNGNNDGTNGAGFGLSDSDDNPFGTEFMVQYSRANGIGWRVDYRALGGELQNSGTSFGTVAGLAHVNGFLAGNPSGADDGLVRIAMTVIDLGATGTVDTSIWEIANPSNRIDFTQQNITDPSVLDRITVFQSITVAANDTGIDIDNIKWTREDAFVWGATGGGNWNTSANWVPTGTPGDGSATADDDKVTFGSAITSNATVFSDSGLELNNITFDNSSASYIVAGTGGVSMIATTGAVNPTIDVDSGDHTFQTPVAFDGDTTITVNSGSLAFDNQIDLKGNTLILFGGATSINHSVVDSVGGGSILGALASLSAEGDTTIGANLTLSDTNTLAIDLGASGSDSFSVTGDVSLDGVLDVTLADGYLPSGSYTVLTAGGTLTDNGLTLHPSDVGAFSLSVTGGNVMLTAVPEPTAITLLLLGAVACFGSVRNRVRNRVRNSVPNSVPNRVPNRVPNHGGRIAFAVAIVGLATALANTALAVAPRAIYSEDFESGSNPQELVTPGVFSGGDWTKAQDLTEIEVREQGDADPPLTTTGAAVVGDSHQFINRQFGIWHTTVDNPLDDPSATDYEVSFNGYVDAYAGNNFGTSNAAVGLGIDAPDPGPDFFTDLGIRYSRFNDQGWGFNTTLLGGGFEHASDPGGLNISHSILTGVEVLGTMTFDLVAQTVTAKVEDKACAATNSCVMGTDLIQFTPVSYNNPTGNANLPLINTLTILNDNLGAASLDAGMDVDNLLVTQTVPNQFTWDSTGGGNSNTGTNWSPNETAGDGANLLKSDEVTFGSTITSNSTVFSDKTFEVNQMTFDNSTANYNIAGPGVSLVATTAAVNPSVTVTNGDHTIQATVSIGGDTLVAMAAGSSLTFDNQVDLQGNALTMTGTASINHSVIDSGAGSISASGILGTAGDTSIDADLILSGTTLAIDVRDPSGSLTSDLFNVLDTVTFNGAITVDVDVLGGFVPGSGVAVLSAAGGITDNSTSLSLTGTGAGLFSGISIIGNNLILSVGGGGGIPGDYNDNGIVAGGDFLLWQQTFGDTVTPGTGADGVADGTINGLDLDFWGLLYGNTTIAAAAAGAAVPEPSSVMLIWLTAATFGILRGRNRR